MFGLRDILTSQIFLVCGKACKGSGGGRDGFFFPLFFSFFPSRIKLYCFCVFPAHTPMISETCTITKLGLVLTALYSFIFRIARFRFLIPKFALTFILIPDLREHSNFRYATFFAFCFAFGLHSTLYLFPTYICSPEGWYMCRSGVSAKAEATSAGERVRSLPADTCTCIVHTMGCST